ncbi:MAG: HDIG domain-containing protein [Acidobacteriia bacterium]|nr:HDIG domain-containing protein [Terriglobia bacterium]
MPNRDDAWALLCEYTQSESLRKHALAVEAVMRAYARKQAEDQDKWGLAGLLHDFDYERYPNAPDHPLKGSEILREKGYPEDLRRAILGHAEYTGVPRDTPLAKVLFACDELTGFVTAVALVKPNKSIFEVEPKSVLKKLKDKAFARSVNRNDILNGASELGVDLNDHIAFVIDSLKPIAKDIGLEGLNTADNSAAAGNSHSST